jgi:hypothetical protein
MFDAQHRREARLQLGEVDRFGDVVVGAGVQPFDLVFGRVERGLHDDRNERQRRIGLHTLRHFDAVHLGHHDVEQHEVGRRFFDLFQRFRSVAGAVGGVAPRLETGAQQLDVVLMIVDDQDPRGFRLRRFTRRFHRFFRGSVELPPRLRAARTASQGSRRTPLPSPSRDPRPTRVPSTR